MRVVFRVDASPTIGTGHVFRCLALATALRTQGARVEFICRGQAGSLPDQVLAQNIPVHYLPHGRTPTDKAGTSHRQWLGASTDEDVLATLAVVARGERPAWLVVDHYALDARWESSLRDAVGRIAVIDDLGDRPHDCDLLIDQNFGAEAKPYPGLVPDDCRLMLGPDYAMLRGEFADLRRNLRPRDGVLRRVMVFYGGSDTEGHTLTALEALTGLTDMAIAADVVVGKYNPHLPAIEASCTSLPGVRLHVQTPHMAALMNEADLMVCAAGATTWERCCLGLPAVTVCTAENQVHPATSMAAAGLAVHLGHAATVGAEILRNALHTMVASPWLLRSIGHNCAKLVDGQGARRIASAMTGGMIVLREAAAADCENLFLWRNDPEVRRHSLDSRPLEFTAHQKWFSKVLESADRPLLIGASGGDDVGVIRFDVEGREAVVSVYLRPGCIGHGYGAMLIDAGSRWVREHCAGVKCLVAEIKPENIASIRAFEAAGYSRHALIYRKELSDG